MEAIRSLDADAVPELGKDDLAEEAGPDKPLPLPAPREDGHNDFKDFIRTPSASERQALSEEAEALITKESFVAPSLETIKEESYRAVEEARKEASDGIPPPLQTRVKG
eukprot:scaffold4858_cov115-Pinguiococcus_pyrenoidosus.AAC.1